MDLHSLLLLLHPWPAGNAAILLYLGPETIMPVGSFLAAALGIFLIFWRQVMLAVRTSFKRLFNRKPDPAPPPNQFNVEGTEESSSD
jgi:hypothetical protein